MGWKHPRNTLGIEKEEAMDPFVQRKLNPVISDAWDSGTGWKRKSR